MRPGTAALPTAGVSSNASAGARAFLPAPSRCMFGGPIWGMETGRMTGHWADGEYGIWGQARCFVRYADLVPGTMFAHKNQAAASCRTPSASRLPTPTASAAAREKLSGSAARSNDAIRGQTHSWLGALQTVPWRRSKRLAYHNKGQKAFSFPRKRGSLTAIGCSAHRAMPRPRPLECHL